MRQCQWLCHKDRGCPAHRGTGQGVCLSLPTLSIYFLYLLRLVLGLRVQ